MFRWQNALLHHFYLNNIIKYNLSPPPSPHTHMLLQLYFFGVFLFTYKEGCDTRITSSDPDIWEYKLNAELILFKLPSGRPPNSSSARHNETTHQIRLQKSYIRHGCNFFLVSENFKLTHWCFVSMIKRSNWIHL